MKLQKTPYVVTIQGTSILKLILSCLLLIFLLFSVSGLLTSLNPQYQLRSSSVNKATMNVSGNVLFQLMARENHYFMSGLVERDEVPSMSSVLFKASTNVNLDDPRSLLGRELPGFSLFDGKILVAGEGTNYTNMPIESAPPEEALNTENEASLQNTDDITKEEPNKVTPPLTTGDKKVAYIYFSHTRESYLPYLKGVTDPNSAQHSEINVTKIGDRLQERLEGYGVGTIVDKTDITNRLNSNGWTYGRSYDASRALVQEAMAGNSNLSYLIDIHRDSRRKEDTTKVINGKSYAKLAFVIGAEHPNYEKNLKLATEIHKKLEEKYPGLSRGIIQKSGASTNGRFNQDLSGNALLVEFGGVDNNFDELNLSADAFADVFSEIFWDAEKVNYPVTVPSEEQ
ncbi:stage II sporulation protein P [Robertmurraya sp.]|jgi:stage II sporulation protein P|uniref:stage II sporulation protein P n=1 Tax=Robertmurraya sp. TaxID=2837525 RepID=UPI0037049B76